MGVSAMQSRAHVPAAFSSPGVWYFDVSARWKRLPSAADPAILTPTLQKPEGFSAKVPTKAPASASFHCIAPHYRRANHAG